MSGLDGELESVRLPVDDDLAALYSVGQVASFLGVQPAFLRRLDSEEVVRPARSEGGQRRYSRTEIRSIQRVQLLVGEGLTLAGVQRVLVLEAEVAALRAELVARERDSAAGGP